MKQKNAGLVTVYYSGGPENRVDYSKSTNTFLTKCVFHKEETPSLIIYPDRDDFHCFGCHANGVATVVGHIEGNNEVGTETRARQYKLSITK